MNITEDQKRVLVVLCMALGHFLVDAISIGLVYAAFPSALSAGGTIYAYFLLYNSLAFGLQVAFGWFADRTEAVTVLRLALVLVGAAVLIGYISPLFALIVAGVGNALFHVSAGSLVAKVSQGKNWPFGVFLAPGPLGVYVGSHIVHGSGPEMLLGTVVLFAITWLSVVQRKELMKVQTPKRNLQKKRGLTGGVLLFLAIIGAAIVLRCASEPIISHGWQSDWLFALLLSVGFGAGKALGGFMSDMNGRVPVVVGCVSLMVVASLLPQNPYIAAMTMAILGVCATVSLTSILEGLPTRPGLGFGLFGTALFVGGVMPTLTFTFAHFVPIASATILLFGVLYWDKNYRKEKGVI